MTGYQILGTNGTDRVITIRVKNALDLAKTQSALATAASWVPGAGPDFVEGQAYEAIAQKIGEALVTQKVDAEVKVIDGAGIVPATHTFFTVPSRPIVPSTPGTEPESDLWKFTKTYGWGVGVGVGLSGIALAIWHYFLRGEVVSSITGENP